MCHVCDKEFSTPFNLRRHTERCHESGGDSRVSRAKYNGLQQTGGGRNAVLGDAVEEDDDGEVTDDTSSNGNSDESSNANSDDSSDVSTAEEGKADEGDIFDDILRMAERNVASREEDTTHTDLQKEFREIYKETVLRKRLLNKSSDHKRVMKTVDELRERHEDFSFEEALEEAVRLRRQMLDDMVPVPSAPQESESTSQESDDDDAEAT